MTVEPMTDAELERWERFAPSPDGAVGICRDVMSMLARIRHERSRADAAEAARDAALARAMPPWHPIETAPHGQLVLLYCPDRGPTNPERIELDYASRGSRNAVGSTVSRHAWATMWQPLPDLPIPPAPATTEE